MQLPDDQIGAPHSSCWPGTVRCVRALATCLLLLMVGFLSAEQLSSAVHRWITEPQYYHCWLVPMISAAIAWQRRDRIQSTSAQCCLPGLVLLLVGMSCQLIGRHVGSEVLQIPGMLSGISGVMLLLWGKSLFVAFWPAVMYLGFLLPLPASFETAFALPLQEFGAREAAWYVQTCGIPAHASGSSILMTDAQLSAGIVFSGLRMLTLYLAVTAAVAIFSRRALWERLVILWTALPIAFICSVIHLTAMAIIQQTMGSGYVDSYFPAVSTCVMVPVAILLLGGGMCLFDWIFIEVEQQSPEVCIALRMPRAIRGTSS